MATSSASTVVLAPIEDVWSYLAEPYHLPDWWPGLATVRPDRKGLAPGARWTVQTSEPSLFRRAAAEDTLLVLEAARPSRIAFELVRARTRATLELAPAESDRTRAELRVEEPFGLAFVRGRRAKDALDRLHDLVQMGAAY